MSHFFVPPESVSESLIELAGAEAHHILHVMRLARGDRITAFDGTGRQYAGVIESAGRKGLTIRIEKTVEEPRGAHLRFELIQAIPKKDRMDYVVEKSTELGVSSITPVITDRTVVSWDREKAAKMRQRWQRIALAASKQSGRLDVPAVGEIRSFDDVTATLPGVGLRIIAALDDSARPIKELAESRPDGSVAAAIGPEGDFSPREIGLATARGFSVVSLGRNVLKSDTAGVFVLSVLNYLYA